ncbi:MAG: pyruvate formate lyase family protein, partial [Treponema sp.]|nr:pyruvate formate lyase family protein [Treponema sp.]
MTAYIRKLLDFYVVRKEHHKFRIVNPELYQPAETYAKQGLSDVQRSAARLRWVLEQEKPVVFPGEKITLLRTVTKIPEIFTLEEFDSIKSSHAIHEQGKVSNVNARYSLLLDTGTRQKRKEIQERLAKFEKDADNSAQTEFLCAALDVLDGVEAFAEKYRQEALKAGDKEIAAVFERIPAGKPESFHEALQSLRLLHYCLWCSFNYHNTFGCFDQYMYPYYKNDIEKGVINAESALELLEEFFISCNKDSDLYPGMQQGDNGQSIVLGGLNVDGSESYNELSALCLDACLELRLIDPKINLRVNKKTPIELYDKGSVLTKQGLGFPQYSNDDVVIEALKRWGYTEEDACNYVVAACWEFIVPGAGMDIV